MEPEEPKPPKEQGPSAESLRLRRRYARLAGVPTEPANDWDRVWRRDGAMAKRLLTLLVIAAGIGAAVLAAFRR